MVNALIGLVDKSVVLREGERYRMLDTLREFGAERLAESGELASCRARHIARYLAMARYFGVHFADDDQMDRYHELRETHPNLRAALEYALELDDDAAAEPDEAAGTGRPWRPWPRRPAVSLGGGRGTVAQRCGAGLLALRVLADLRAARRGRRTG